ncbi:unnamed protein product, partial [Polarella glacialis]
GLNFGDVPAGGEGRKTVRAWNLGNGTARLRLAALAYPFTGPFQGQEHDILIEPHTFFDAIVTCAPKGPGT